MPITIAVLTETAPHETRVALTPDAVTRLGKKNVSVQIQSGAGTASGYTDAAYSAAGATVNKTAAATCKNADILLCVQNQDSNSIKDKIVIGLLSPHALEPDCAMVKNTTAAIALELIPRTSRAQAMDVLSSQANLAGYKAVIESAYHFKHGFPLLMTAAGTVPAAKVFVMGAGVAGLQAIATARRLGAVVSATDVRLAAKEQVQSLGAKFIMVEDDETKAAETSGGYAKEMSESYKAKQAQLLADTVKSQDIIITTALIPGRPAPKLLSAAMVQSMKAGSVVCDLAASNGGNCDLTVADKVVTTENGVTIVGHSNWSSTISADASQLYARNILALLDIIMPKEGEALSLNLSDDILLAATLAQNGAPIHPLLLNKIKT